MYEDEKIRAGGVLCRGKEGIEAPLFRSLYKRRNLFKSLSLSGIVDDRGEHKPLTGDLGGSY